MSKENKFRKLASMLCLLALVIGLAGCSKKASDSGKEIEKLQEAAITEKEAARGRYVEHELQLADGLNQEGIDCVVQGPGGIEIYGYDDKETFCQYIYSKGNWEKKECKWYEELRGRKESLFYVTWGGDGSYYILAHRWSQEGGLENYVYRISEDHLVPVELNFFEDSQQDNPMLLKIGVLKDGTIVYSDGNSCFMRNKEDKQIYYEDECFDFCICEDQIAVFNQRKKSVDLLDPTGKTVKNYPVEFQIGSCALGCYDEDLYVFSDKGGLFCCNREGSIWQNLIDLSILTMPNINPEMVYAEKNGKYTNYIVVTRDNEGIYYLLSYEYDETMLATPLEEFTIFSLEENATVRQAISAYKKAYPEIGIQYIIADQAVPLDDTIRSLNTELLAGNGADLLVLDGLPVQNYCEKGMLADLSDVVKEFLLSGQLMSNVMNSFCDQGIYYSVPAKIMIPLVYGEKEVIDSMDSLQDLLSYLQSDKREDIFEIDRAEIPAAFLKLYYDEIIDPATGQVNQNAFKAYVEIVKELMERAALQNPGASDEITERTEASHENYSLDKGFGDYVGNQGDKATRVIQLEEDHSIAIPYNAQTKEGMECESFHQMMVPSTLVGVNVASSHRSLAEDFVRMLWSNEVQSAANNDGLPVRPDVIEKVFVPDRFDDGMMLINEDKMIAYESITEDQVQQFKTILTTVSKRYSCDSRILDMIVSGVEEYLEGTQELDGFCHEVENKIARYLEE